MQRMAMVINVRPEKLDEYRRLHAEAWPEVLAALSRAHVRNYSIHLKDHTLFGYLEMMARTGTPTWRGWPPIRRRSAGGP